MHSFLTSVIIVVDVVKIQCLLHSIYIHFQLKLLIKTTKKAFLSLYKEKKALT